MKQLLRILILVTITALMASCKLAVIVVEGGEVQSNGSGTCMAGTICIVEVTDPNFSETFTAIPDADWYFEKWNSGGGFFCGGSTKPTCALSFQGHEDSQAVEDMVKSPQVFYLMPIFTQSPSIIEVEGKQWYQPDLFSNLSWDDINEVCPKGACSGKLKGQDVTGWKWATIDDMNALFNHYIGANVLGPGPDRILLDWGDSEAVTAFYNDGWRSSFSGEEDLVDWGVTQGWVSDSTYRPWVTRCCMYADMMATKPENVLADGAWFYRNL